MLINKTKLAWCKFRCACAEGPLIQPFGCSSCYGNSIEQINQTTPPSLTTVILPVSAHVLYAKYSSQVEQDRNSQSPISKSTAHNLNFPNLCCMLMHAKHRVQWMCHLSYLLLLEVTLSQQVQRSRERYKYMVNDLLTEWVNARVHCKGISCSKCPPSVFSDLGLGRVLERTKYIESYVKQTRRIAIVSHLKTWMELKSSSCKF